MLLITSVPDTFLFCWDTLTDHTIIPIVSIVWQFYSSKDISVFFEEKSDFKNRINHNNFLKEFVITRALPPMYLIQRSLQ